jgi:hypothetical protein
VTVTLCQGHETSDVADLMMVQLMMLGHTKLNLKKKHHHHHVLVLALAVIDAVVVAVAGAVGRLAPVHMLRAAVIATVTVTVKMIMLTVLVKALLYLMHILHMPPVLLSETMPMSLRATDTMSWTPVRNLSVMPPTKPTQPPMRVISTRSTLQLLLRWSLTWSEWPA